MPADAEPDHVDHDALTSAGPTQLSPASGDALAYSAETEVLDPPRREWFTPGRITVAAVVVSLVLIVAVAVYVGYALGSRPSPTASSPATPSIASMAAGAPKPPPLDGVYRITYDAAKQKVNGIAAAAPEGNTTFWAFRSQCGDAACLASATPLDSNHHDQPRSPTVILNLQYIGGHWISDPLFGPVPQQECLFTGNRIAPGSHTQRTFWDIEPVSKEELRGSSFGHTVTNECGFRGNVIDLPVTMNRIGDTPSTVHLPEPSPIKASTPDPTRRPGPLDGMYRFTIDHTKQTVNGLPATGPAKARTEVWAIRSLCASAGCVATAAQVITDNPQQNTGQAITLDYIDGQWTQPLLSPMPPDACPGGGAQSDIYGIKWTLTRQSDGSLRGATTAVTITNQCGHEGRVYESPMTAIRTGDIPPSVVIADPTLFLD
ncbi:hypothetical protein [Mycolicibacterium sp. lyk4-40-TYG-92]|uniref:hypothetical protein n=1 Tax=Mycolicibacterium sp. lyk4-40-TYG-92 TaxID=3040295 RepID=UPI00254CB36A|nr:hypothetical protein [Mycolicibacterium sp. lyk4-40-TYG-92]